MIRVDNDNNDSWLIRAKLTKLIIFNPGIALFLALFFVVRYYNFNFLLVEVAYFGCVFYAINKTSIQINNKSITARIRFGRRTFKTLYHASIDKIEYNHVGLGDYFYIYEPSQKKYSMAISPQLFSPKDIRDVLRIIMSRNPNIQLDQRAQNFLGQLRETSIMTIKD